MMSCVGAFSYCGTNSSRPARRRATASELCRRRVPRAACLPVGRAGRFTGGKPPVAPGAEAFSEGHRFRRSTAVATDDAVTAGSLLLTTSICTDSIAATYGIGAYTYFQSVIDRPAGSYSSAAAKPVAFGNASAPGALAACRRLKRPAFTRADKLPVHPGDGHNSDVCSPTSWP